MPVELPKEESFEQQVLHIGNENTFHQIALLVFKFQYQNNRVYQEFCNILGKTPDNVKRLTDLPFLPISFFKSKEIITTAFEPQVIFESSGTTGSTNSRHLVKNIELYRKSFIKTFEQFYGSPRQYCFLGLLPSYLERKHSSLVFMVQELMQWSCHPSSGFYLNNLEKLQQTLLALEKAGQKTILIGVTYALLDFAQQFSFPLKHTIIIETGGMKGRRQELVRNEVHALIKDAFKLPQVHSEYGMTELLSQAYALKKGLFKTPFHMKVLLREEDDPSAVLFPKTTSITAAINIIDLANLYSCSFIATDDIGRLYPDGTFEVLGRLDNSDIRGCSLLSL